jgi:hypothetical protein
MLKTVSAGTIGALVYKGVWNAATNSPTLTSGVGNQGDYYVVGTPGNTNLDGITVWSVGDWAVFNGTAWQKVDGGTSETYINLTVTGTANIATGNVANLVSANVTITAGNVAANIAGSFGYPVANVVGAGTMATQNANSVTITGGNVAVNILNATTGNITNLTVTANATVSGNASVSGNVVVSGTITGNASITGGNVAANIAGSSGYPVANVVGIGTMATQNANSVTITGGNVAVNIANATTLNVATAIVTGNQTVLGNTTISGNATVSGNVIGNVSATNVVAVSYQISSTGVVTETTTARTLSASDNGKIIYCTNTSAITITTASGLGSGFVTTVFQGSTGNVTIAAGSGTTVKSYSSNLVSKGQYARISIFAPVANAFIATGDIGAAVWINA